MGSKKQLEMKDIKPWFPENATPAPEGRGPLEHVFTQMFSMKEKLESTIGGAPMGEDPHFDARQSLLCMSKMVDMSSESIRSRVVLNLEDNTESMVVDFLMFKETKVWTKTDKNNEPIVFIRFAHHTNDAENLNNNPVDILKVTQAIGMSMPKKGASNINCASKDEMRILRELFAENASKISTNLRGGIERSMDKKLSRIPFSYTSFLSTMPIPEAEREKHFCKVCGDVAKKVCTQCKVTRYCGKKCQVQDWKSGHKRECKTPEAIALEQVGSENQYTDEKIDLPENENGDNPWVDFDPKRTPEECSYLSTIGMNSAVSRLPKPTQARTIFADYKTDKMFTVKVQIPPGSSKGQFLPMILYPQGKKFQLCGVPQNIIKRQDDYCRLHELVATRGFDGGLGMGGCKAYLNAYVTSDGLLRVMMNNIKPMQKW